ncbi:MAG: hypothetical protein WD046_11870 [Paracoccaceae bacterium]
MAAALSLFAAPLAAQGFEGAFVDLQDQIYNDGDGFTVDQAEALAHASYTFGGYDHCTWRAAQPDDVHLFALLLGAQRNVFGGSDPLQLTRQCDHLPPIFI